MRCRGCILIHNSSGNFFFHGWRLVVVTVTLRLHMYQSGDSERITLVAIVKKRTRQFVFFTTYRSCAFEQMLLRYVQVIFTEDFIRS